MRSAAEHGGVLVQTRQDLHSRHAREQEALQAQIVTLQKASAVASLPDVMKRQALMEVSRLKEENEGLQQRLHAAEADATAADAVAELQVRGLRAACCVLGFELRSPGPVAAHDDAANECTGRSTAALGAYVCGVVCVGPQKDCHKIGITKL